jgi:hypothetical protein
MERLQSLTTFVQSQIDAGATTAYFEHLDEQVMRKPWQWLADNKEFQERRTAPNTATSASAVGSRFRKNTSGCIFV